MSADAWAYADPSACPKCGRDSCEEHLPDDSTGGTATKPRLRFARATDVISEPAPLEIVEGLAWSGCITTFTGPPGEGKTFTLLDIAKASSNGLPWHGRAVEHGSFAYISFEGDALGKRLLAIQQAGYSIENIHVLRASEPLSPQIDRDGTETPSAGERATTEALVALNEQIEAEVGPALVGVVVDTIRASLVGSEDGSGPVSAYLRAVRRIMATAPRATCILAHHTGWQDEGEPKRRRERGSSAFRGNVEAAAYLELVSEDAEKGTAVLELLTHKAKDDGKAQPLRLLRRRVYLQDGDGQLLLDRRGKAVSTCVIEADPVSASERAAADAAAERQRDLELDLQTLRTIIKYPDVATSQDRVRQLLGIRKEAIGDSVGRILRAGWVIPGRRGHPFIVTDAGQSAARNGASP